MGRQPCCDKIGLKKGPWTAEEDRKLVNFISQYGHSCWRAVPKLAGLLRCGKSCRLRWTNYLRPDLKRGFLTDSEEKRIIEIHAVIGNKWSKIAAELPGRTDNEIKNYWNTRIKKRLRQMGIDPSTHQPLHPSPHHPLPATHPHDHTHTGSVASSDKITTLSHSSKDPDSTSLNLSPKFEDQLHTFTFDPSPSPPTNDDMLHQVTPAMEAALDFVAMPNKNSSVRRYNPLVGDPLSPTSVFSHGLSADEEDESSSLTKFGGGSTGQAPENEIQSENWIDFPLQLPQMPCPETHNWAPPAIIPKQETTLLNDITPQKNLRKDIPWNDAGASSYPLDQTHHDWINIIPVEESISQPYYELGDGEMVGNSNTAPWLRLSDGYPSWDSCQELHKLAAILDDL